MWTYSDSGVGGALVELADVEERIVAKAARRRARPEDLAVPFALGNDRLWVVGVANENDHRNETGRAPVVFTQFDEQLLVVAGIGFRLARVACR
jgi:hypothetical protein